MIWPRAGITSTVFRGQHRFSGITRDRTPPIGGVSDDPTCVVGWSGHCVPFT